MRRLCLSALLVLAVNAGCAPEERVPVPKPGLENVDASVREAIVELRVALEQSPQHERAGAYGALGRMYYAYGMLDAAEACFLNAVQLDDGDFAALYFLALIDLEGGQLEQASERLRTVLEWRDDYTAARIRLGKILIDLGDTDAGREQLTRVVDDPPYTAAARYSLGRLAAAEGDTAAAVAHFESVLELQPEATRVHYPLGQAYRKLGDTENAARHVQASGDREVVFPDPLIESLRQLTAGAADLLNTSGRAFFEGEFAAAEAGYRQAIAMAPGNVEAHKGLALTLERLGDLSGAEEHFREARRLSPDDPDVERGLGVLLQSRGALSEALASLQRAVELDPGSVEARLALSGVLLQVERLDEAEGLLDDLLEADLAPPMRARTLFNLGVLGSIRGDEAASRGRYREALEIDPGLGEARLFFAAGLAREGRYDEAAAQFKLLVDREPLHLQARLAEATALVLAGRHEQTRERLEEGLARTDGAPLLALALAKLLATSPIDEVRDGAQALTIARQLHDARPSLEHMEVLAMALAETGDFGSAVTLQRELVARASEMGEAGLVRQFGRDLARYERNEPARTP